MNKNHPINQISKDVWVKRFVACEPRLSEALEAYQEAGFETRIEPLPKQSEGDTCSCDEEYSECRICFEGHEDEYYIIYTRSKSGRSDNDLF